MTSPERMRYGTFVLGGEGEHGLEGNPVHLRSRLPEIIAMGTDSAREFMDRVPPLGGPHAEWVVDALNPAKLVVETPECSFVYQVVALKTDSAGWYFIMRRAYVSEAYSAWVETL